MTDHELEQRLRAWYRAEIDEGGGAPQQLRADLATLAQRAGTSRRRYPAERTIRFLHPGVPFALSAAAIVVALLVGIGVLLRTSGVGSSPIPSPKLTPAGPIPLLVGCSPHVTRCQDIPAGTYVTTGNHAFLPGLTVTLPAGWSSTEQDAGEFNLHPVGDTNLSHVLFFWHDIVAVGNDGRRAVGIGTTPDDLADFFASDPRLIVSDRGTAAIGDGLAAVTLVMRVNPTGPNNDPAGCPGENCVIVLTDPAFWDVDFVMTANSSEDASQACPCSHAVRLYLAAVGTPSDPHTFVVAVMAYAPDPVAALATFQIAVQSIIHSVRLPAQ